MGNKSKVDQSAPRHINDYERNKMMRVQENQERLRELGVKNIAKSLTSLVESKKPKKRKEKAMVTNERDEEYIPDLGVDCEADYEEQVDASVGVHKKVHRPKYIAPMSMNKFANLAKQRVTTQDIFNMSPFERVCEKNRQFSDSNATKKSRLHHCEKGHEQHGEVGDLNASQHNRSRENFTMGELLLNKKGIEKLNGVNNEKPMKPNSTSARLLRRPTRKSFLIDEDCDDWEDELRCQDGDNIDARHNLLIHEDENDNIKQMAFKNTQKYGERYETSSEGDTEADSAAEDESEDVEHLVSDHLENGMERYHSKDYAGNEDDELAQEELQAPSNIKKRGPTMMHGVHVRELNNREVIICNKYGQPIGPSTKEKDTVGEFSRFFGTIARTYSYAPLNCISWHKVSHKERMWEYVLEKYIVPENAKSWVIKSIGAAWRVHKCRVKKDHYYEFKDNKTRWKNRPQFIPEDDFLELLRLWSRKEVMNRCSKARDARMSQKNMHTAGPKSFARIHEEMTNEDPNKEPPTLTQMFERTRKRTEGNVYVDSYDDTAKKIEQMKNFKPSENESGSVDPFLAVMSKEYDGHRRLYGRGVTNKLIKKVGCSDGSYMVPDVLMESIKSSLEEEKNKVVDMRKELEAEHEKKKLELQEEHERKKAELEAMIQDLNNQRDKIVEEAVQKLIEKLPSKVVRKLLA